MKAHKRSPANFMVTDYSAVFKRTVVWKVQVTESGISAHRHDDNRKVAIDWRTLFGAAMFYGHDSARGEACKL